jgi:threonylcarbamoyladenosine tRNA methylthiotransferase MtaB
MFLDRCRMLRDALHQPAITTDVIVGFPGETQAEFEQTLQTCREAGFSKIHAFPFSPRRGTPAAEMPDQIPKSIRSQRVAMLGQLEASLREDYYSSLVDSRVELLVESSSPLISIGTNATSADRSLVSHGTTCRYAPAELVESIEALQSETRSPPANSALMNVHVDATDGEKLIVSRLP